MRRIALILLLAIPVCRGQDLPEPPPLTPVAAVDSRAPIAAVESRALTVEQAHQALLELYATHTPMGEALRRAKPFAREGTFRIAGVACELESRSFRRTRMARMAPGCDLVETGIFEWDPTRDAWPARLTDRLWICRRPKRR